MKKLIFIFALLVSTISFGQELNDNAKNIKESAPDIYQKIELVVTNLYELEKTSSVYNTIINQQADALFDYLNLSIDDFTTERKNKFNELLVRHTKTIDGVENCTDYILLMSGLNR
ncbi:hypothetical protein N8Z99_00485 [Flavobacteriaceae bacterium]|nr:hypothetical protein [Flavobacteriaceae bacterium]